MATETHIPSPALGFAEGPHRMLIGGQWVRAASGRSFPTVNPATGEDIAEIPYAEAVDVDRAVKEARKAFEEGPWTTSCTAADRSRILYRVAELIHEAADELAQIESLDNGKPVKYARFVDVAAAADHFAYYAGWP